MDSMSVGAGFGACMYFASVSSMSAFEGRTGFGFSGVAINLVLEWERSRLRDSPKGEVILQKVENGWN